MFSFNKYHMRTQRPKDFIYDEDLLRAMRMALRDFGFRVEPQIDKKELLDLYVHAVSVYGDNVRNRVADYKERLK